MPELLGIPLSGMTAPALLSVAILMLLTGRLWTNAAYQQKVKEAEHWRQAYEAEREARITAEGQNGELLELAKTTYSFITATFANSERIARSGEPDVVSKT